MTDVIISNILVEALVEAPDNPNYMAPAQYDALVAEMQQEGHLQPILARPLGGGRYRVIDGHHRLRAAKLLGMADVPVVIKETSDAGEVLLRIAMNKLRGELDLTGVGRAFRELRDAGVAPEEMAITGFSLGEVSDLLAAVGRDVDVALAGTRIDLPAEDAYTTDEDEVPARPFALTLEFRSREELTRVRRALKRAAGKSKDMTAGLLNLLGEEKQKKRKEEA